jgi:hypothetical protein
MHAKVMKGSEFCSVICLSFLLVTGCGAESDCSEDYFTPALVQKLTAINTPEALLAASAITRWEFIQDKDLLTRLPGSFHLRKQALQLAPDDEMVLSFAGNACSASNPEKDPDTCSLEWATKLRDLDPENGFYWANLAHYQLSEGYSDAALQSYQLAAKAPMFSIGWGRQVYWLSMALKEALPSKDSCSAMSAVGLVATNLPAVQEFTETCRSHSGKETWRNACLDLGRKMETQSKTLVSRMIGFALQRIAHEATEDESSLAAIEARRLELQGQFQKQGELVECRMEDPDWIDEWLVSMRDFGEMETMRLMSKALPYC